MKGLPFLRNASASVTKLLSEIVDVPDVGQLRIGRRITSNECRDIVQRLKQQVPYGSVFDDLADIWRELKNGLFALKKDDVNAICAWRFSFFFTPASLLTCFQGRIGIVDSERPVAAANQRAELIHALS